MKILGVIDTDFVNYIKPAMTVLFPYCNLKCNREAGFSVCQNEDCLNSDLLEISSEKLINHYLKNPLTTALILQGMEPLDSYEEVKDLLKQFRLKSNDKIVIYTGYKEEEILDKIDELKNFHNIIIKLGRFIPNQNKHYDPILGVKLASDNQYAKEYI